MLQIQRTFGLFYAAEVARKNNKHTDAIKFYETFLESNPSHREALNGLSSSKLVLSDWKNLLDMLLAKKNFSILVFLIFPLHFANSRET